MARHLRPCTAQLYDAATRWRIDCLDSDGSLLSTGRSVWTADVLEELAGCLVVSADEREGSFITKLKAQLADASADAVQLTAELHIVHFLIWWTEGSGSISYATKRSQLDEILSWRPDSPAVPDQVDELLRCGIVRMGQHALSKRYTQLNYLIQLARTWKRLPSADKRTYATDPWSFRELAETIDAPSSDAQRLAIQYLLFPDTFEPIVNANHKQLIIDRYRDVANGERDVDRALLSIRASLEPAWGERFHWYDEPRQRTWNKGERWATFMDWARQFRALPDFDVEERDYKFEAAEVTGNAKHAYVSDQTDWPDLLKRALSSKVQNIVNYMVVSPMLRWINEHPDDARQLFANLWKSEKSVTDRLAEFAAATPPDFATSPGLRINLISYLLMAEDPPNIPPYKATAIKMAWDLAGWKRPPTSNEAETYNWFIALCDEMVHDATAWPLALRDRLDAQSVIWGITKWSGEPTWPPGRWQELLEYRQTASKVIDEDDEDEPADDRRAHGDPAVSVDYLNEAAKRANVDREELAEIVELLKDKRQVIFYGPPGTGKTWVAQELALAIAERSA